MSGESPNCRALAYHQDQLRGFALSGACVKERSELLKKL
ncbi:MAG TPA: hypothetical protein VD770_03965 [Coxiellaceae bacterium]|nr:hypothetical protein [Coxiellaceae bacterium]